MWIRVRFELTKPAIMLSQILIWVRGYLTQTKPNLYPFQPGHTVQKSVWTLQIAARTPTTTTTRCLTGFILTSEEARGFREIKFNGVEDDAVVDSN